MKTHRMLLAAPLLVLFLSGCGRSGDVLTPSSAPSGSAEQASVSQELARHPELIEEAMSESPDQAAVEPAAGGPAAGIAAAIDPLFFWREIKRVERYYEFTFGDTDSTGRPTTAVVTIHKHLAGWFNVIAKEAGGEGEPVEGRLVQKPLHDRWVRRLLLKRVNLPDSDRRPWRVAATSGVKITSRDAETRIESLRVQSGVLDTTLTDPLAFFRLRRLLKLEPEAEVTLTVATLRNDDVVILYCRDRRFRFHNNGDNTYIAMWKAAALTGVHHFGVNALDHGTLYDDEAPYDSQAWILPYVTVPTELADMAP